MSCHDTKLTQMTDLCVCSYITVQMFQLFLHLFHFFWINLFRVDFLEPDPKPELFVDTSVDGGDGVHHIAKVFFLHVLHVVRGNGVSDVVFDKVGRVDQKFCDFFGRGSGIACEEDLLLIV